MVETVVLIRPFRLTDLAWAESVLDHEFGGRFQARRGELLDVLDLPGFVAEDERGPAGILTYHRVEADCELALLWAREQHNGVGTALVQALRDAVADCERIWLVTSNDNLDALRFYQRRGFALSMLRPGALDETRRRFKPLLPLTGEYGIPLRDELELELRLKP